MKILVTGTAGFIGFHLAERLAKEGHEVVGIDNINDYYDVNLKYARLAESGIKRELITDNGQLIASEKHSNYRFAKIDLTDLPKLEQLFQQEHFTHVMNLAAQPGVRYSIENPHAYVQSNIVGFVNILECCRHNKIEHLVYASSSSVYGGNSKIPFSEEDRVDYPVSLYAATKKSNELMAYTYSHLYNLPTTGLRFFTVYGPWGRPDMAPMLFANAITKGEAIKVFNNGDMERDFTYVDDIVEGVYRCLKVLPTKTPLADVCNIGNSQPIKLMDFIACLEEQLGEKAEKIFLPMQDGDVKRTWADTSALETKVNYKPSTTLNEGVDEFVSWYKEFSFCNAL
ncbi:NAD-dependent epimerase [Ancylomarina sp. 16SWW S1-10-2]|uniref:NAD-dependent epimerase n=1 Tax=Ancylomarina sp. 16SWW S1-10-2 TaxID=2499681 RepID=UPI0012AE6DBE|nr:NAD-dependent epimerase [Ancylomarina sp. 16SWW S1-10-2]MRT91919.1 NAD-dependent epimerase [Ancylomarina sp. 16SWW S1-10-2]